MSEDLIARVGGRGFPVLGRSSEGRPIPVARFGPVAVASSLPLISSTLPILVVAGVHGDEPSSVEAALELCDWLAAHPPRRGVVVVPALNPDGVAHGTKNSATDVDLNRNFPARNFTVQHGPGYSPGPRPLSEPETQLLAALVEGEPLFGVVAVHAPFACVNHDGPARGWAEVVALACGWPVRADIGYPTPGSLGSWLGGDRGMAVLTLELPPGSYEKFRREAQEALQTAINPEGIR